MTNPQPPSLKQVLEQRVKEVFYGAGAAHLLKSDDYSDLLSDLVDDIYSQRVEAQAAAITDYRDKVARELQLDHMARQTYSKTDIIIALDRVDMRDAQAQVCESEAGGVEQ